MPSLSTVLGTLLATSLVFLCFVSSLPSPLPSADTTSADVQPALVYAEQGGEGGGCEERAAWERKGGAVGTGRKSLLEGTVEGGR
jgi:hypothetical protein